MYLIFRRGHLAVPLYSRLKFKKWRSQGSEDGIAEFLTKMEQKKYKNKQNIVCSLNVLYTVC